MRYTYLRMRAASHTERTKSMRLRMLAAPVFALALASTVLAIEDTPENRRAQADRYLAATPPKEMLADMVAQVAKNLPPYRQAEFQDLLTKHLDIEAVTRAIRDAMVRHFTADELAALADFYGSPLGKSAMKKFGAYMADVMPSLQTAMRDANQKAIEEMRTQGAGHAEKLPLPPPPPTGR